MAVTRSKTELGQSVCAPVVCQAGSKETTFRHYSADEYSSECCPLRNIVCPALLLLLEHLGAVPPGSYLQVASLSLV